MAARRLFGTDGIRGLAGRSPLTPNEVLRLGRAAGIVLKRKCAKADCRILGVRDTRWSGESLFAKLSQGLREEGVNVFDAGVLSTPSVAYLVRAHRFDSGVVISASHNPPEFNGIKFFTSHGRKWPDEWELSVENLFFGAKPFPFPEKKGLPVRAGTLSDDYEDFLVKTLGDDGDFSKFRIALDCSHGANSVLGPAIFRRLGAQVFAMGVKPNGKNINVGCGSQHTESLAKLVRSKRCDLGIAFDGDGDRVIMVDEKGSIIDGDHIIAILARNLKKAGRLAGKTAVITVMANLGLKKALARMGIKTIEVAVGDRYVSEAMKKSGAILGGEQSGHIILGEFLPTGDGLLTSLHVLSVAAREKAKLSELAGTMRKFPQVLHNVPVKQRIPLPDLNGVQGKIHRIERTLGTSGRVLVRYSGTEPLLRIMLEGPDKKELQKYADEIAQSVVKAGNAG